MKRVCFEKGMFLHHREIGERGTCDGVVLCKS